MTEQKPPATERKTPTTEQKPPAGRKTTKRRKLSHEILATLGVSFAISIFLFEFLLLTATSIAEGYCDRNDLTLTCAQQTDMEMWIFGVSLLSAVVFFTVLFLFLLGQQIAYIKNITEGVEALRTHRMDFIMPLEGNNELTQLAETINYLSATEKQIREKERALQEEKEQLIRSLSHDIRTPLTSIMSYSELLLTQESAMDMEKCKARDASTAREKEYLELILKKAGQIKDLTDVLLDGGKRNPEYFQDGRLLMEQLAAEAEEALEDAWEAAEGARETLGVSCGLSIDMSECAPFSGTFDVREMRRIFDNLTSNILKYADPVKPVSLKISTQEQGLVIRQENFRKRDADAVESYQIGLSSIRRIAHNYGGSVRVDQDDVRFAITITLSEI